MIDIRRIEELAKRLTEALPPGVTPVRREIEENLRAVLQSQLPRLELVGREEFEAAREMLARTRERVEELETQVAELEQGRDE